MSTIQYLIILIEKYEYDIFKNGKNKYYLKKFRL